MLYPVAGIVAEYNPFHKGHLYHAEKARDMCGAQAVVAVLSSNFVQRGEPAIADKWTRAEMALSCGVDLVLELPAVFSSHNAGLFANGAVDIIAASNIVTHLAFGAETPDCLSDSIVSILLEEPEPFKLSLKKYLASGLSFVEARARAAGDIIPGGETILRGSNNSLALSYMSRIREKNYPIAAVPIERTGSAYNSTELGEIASATALRRAIRCGMIKEATERMPKAAAEILLKAADTGRLCIGQESMWKIFRATLLRCHSEQLRGFGEISEGAEYKMRSASLKAASFDDWLDACTSKRYPSGRVRRAAIHILLGLEHWYSRAAQRLGPPYIRPLAMNGTGRMLLHEMKKNAALPIVTTYGQAARVSRYAAECARIELLACELWEELVPKGRYGEEHKRRVIME